MAYGRDYTLHSTVSSQDPGQLTLTQSITASDGVEQAALIKTVFIEKPTYD
jgi:hypothetical protein